MATNIKGIALPTLQFILTTAGNDYILVNAPKGWDKILVTQQRDQEYYAVKRTYSVPIDFLLDGAYLLREQYYNYGVQATARLTIKQLNPTTQQYDYIITVGDIDFSQYKNSENFVNVNLMDSGIESKIKAYKDVTYEFSMEDGIDIELTPLILEEQADFIFIQALESEPNYFPQLNIVNNPNLSITPSSKATVFEAEDTPDWANSVNNFFAPQLNTTLRLKGYVQGIIGGRSGTYAIEIRDNLGTGLANLMVKAKVGTSAEAFYQDFDVTINAVAGRRYFTYITYYNDGAGFTPLITVSQGQIMATYNTISPSTVSKAFRPKQLFDKLIEKMNGGVYPIASNHLEITWPQLCITSGDAIRRIENPKLKTSWNDFWQSINSVTNAMFGSINGVATLEAKSQAFKRTLPIFSVGEVKDFEDSPYTEIMASKIQVGYEDVDLDTTGGRTVFNAKQEYTTPLTRVQKTLDLISKYGASDLEIELLRVQLDGRDSTDNSGDNKCFFIYVKSEPEMSGAYQPEGEEAFDSVTGLNAGSYNLKISPKQNLYRWGDYLAGMLERQMGGRIFFASATKDVSLVTVDLNGRRIAESENVNIQSLGLPLFLPYIANFKCKIPPNQLLAVQNTPNGYIDFTWQGVPYRGFIQSIGIDPAHNSEQEFTVLLTPDNNLFDLIR